MRSSAAHSDIVVMSAARNFFRIESQEADGVTPEAVLAARSRAEIENAIRALSTAEWARLRLVAARYGAGRRVEAKDLLQEALMRSLDGRHCPSHVDVVRFLAEAMRSIADGEGEKAANRLVAVSVDASPGIEAVVQNHPAPDLGAEAGLIAEGEAAAIRSEILGLFADDPVAEIIVEGIMEEMEGDELRELSGLDATAYDSKRKLIRRRILKRYPNGWKS
jgi:hypothetical protein